MDEPLVAGTLEMGEVGTEGGAPTVAPADPLVLPLLALLPGLGVVEVGTAEDTDTGGDGCRAAAAAAAAAAADTAGGAACC